MPHPPQERLLPLPCRRREEVCHRVRDAIQHPPRVLQRLLIGCESMPAAQIWVAGKIVSKYTLSWKCLRGPHGCCRAVERSVPGSSPQARIAQQRWHSSILAFCQARRIRRVHCPLLSQRVCFLEIRGSSIAGWILPWVSIARDTIACSPGAGFCQSSDQIFQANSPS